MKRPRLFQTKNTARIMKIKKGIRSVGINLRSLEQTYMDEPLGPTPNRNTYRKKNVFSIMGETKKNNEAFNKWKGKNKAITAVLPNFIKKRCFTLGNHHIQH